MSPLNKRRTSTLALPHLLPLYVTVLCVLEAQAVFLTTTQLTRRNLSPCRNSSKNASPNTRGWEIRDSRSLRCVARRIRKRLLKDVVTDHELRIRPPPSTLLGHSGMVRISLPPSFRCAKTMRRQASMLTIAKCSSCSMTYGNKQWAEWVLEKDEALEHFKVAYEVCRRGCWAAASFMQS